MGMEYIENSSHLYIFNRSVCDIFTKKRTICSLHSSRLRRASHFLPYTNAKKKGGSFGAVTCKLPWQRILCVALQRVIHATYYGVRTNIQISGTKTRKLLSCPRYTVPSRLVSSTYGNQLVLLHTFRDTRH